MNFSNTTLYFFLSSLFLMASCSPDPEDLNGGAELSFHSSYGNTYLVMDASYSYREYDVIFSELNFIFSELKLITQEGETIDLQSTGILDFGDLNTIEKATEGISLVFDQLPVGDYSGIQFDLGLGEKYAGTSPADYSSTDVLGNAFNYWPGWQNYITTRLEARFDSDEDGAFNDESFQYHLGGDDAFRTIVLNKSFQIIPDGQTTIDLNIDWRQVLRLDDEQIDPAVHSNTHTSDKEWLITHLMDNMQQEIVFE